MPCRRKHAELPLREEGSRCFGAVTGIHPFAECNGGQADHATGLKIEELPLWGGEVRDFGVAEVFRGDRDSHLTVG